MPVLHEKLTKCTAKSNSEAGPITHGTVLGDANKKTVLWCIVNVVIPRPLAQLQNGKYGYCHIYLKSVLPAGDVNGSDVS